ncbi:MAG: hypothetical protein BWK75_00495 [Candidatus Altiarchaeales archaeon A3]|nr:MAG: hypothetical protein BWK75_00495 [Candidatus Altiarchaeales archaeon A3]
MDRINDWLAQLKTKKPELNNIIENIESFISNDVFNKVSFEYGIKSGLKKIEDEVNKSFNSEENVQNK